MEPILRIFRDQRWHWRSATVLVCTYSLRELNHV